MAFLCRMSNFFVSLELSSIILLRVVAFLCVMFTSFVSLVLSSVILLRTEFNQLHIWIVIWFSVWSSLDSLEAISRQWLIFLDLIWNLFETRRQELCLGSILLTPYLIRFLKTINYWSYFKDVTIVTNLADDNLL